jgi:hypothetical protein
MSELDAAAKRLEAAKKNTLRTEVAHRTAITHERDMESAYKTIHSKLHPPPVVEIVVPEGMKQVGWYCEHTLITDDTKGWTYTPHRQPSTKNKQGWTESTNTMRSLSGFGDDPLTEAEAEKHCQYRKPVFVMDDSATHPERDSNVD